MLIQTQAHQTDLILKNAIRPGKDRNQEPLPFACRHNCGFVINDPQHIRIRSELLMWKPIKDSVTSHNVESY